ncbi:uncharacterized protein LOC133298092 [Gastrolobium bilobum]|uniref:uncharacterized protein LOC133298092 n=1 Tax=Gastrolobium bilobum TaxID=150636 RepID=UPI002AB132C9|nr:uncharacterized protein LOC133298092 [Gastrolobium bilobum]
MVVQRWGDFQVNTFPHKVAAALEELHNVVSTARGNLVQNVAVKPIQLAIAVKITKQKQFPFYEKSNTKEGYQKSQCIWLKFGDKNTKFFHAATVNRRRRNKIVSIKNTHGVWVSDPKEMVNVSTNFFEELYIQATEPKPILPICGVFHSLYDHAIFELGRFPHTEEIKRVVFTMGKFQAPGPNGLHAAFLQTEWKTVGMSICRLICEVFHSPHKVKDINQTLLCLIPKVDSLENMNQFRPISLAMYITKLSPR